MTEPGAGSDVQGIRTPAVKAGEEYVINGAKSVQAVSELKQSTIVPEVAPPSLRHRRQSQLERELEAMETSDMQTRREG